MFHFGTPFVDGVGSTKVTRFDLGGLYRCPESDSAHLLFAAKGVTFRYPPAGGVSLTYVIGAFLFSIQGERWRLKIPL